MTCFARLLCRPGGQLVPSVFLDEDFWLPGSKRRVIIKM